MFSAIKNYFSFYIIISFENYDENGEVTSVAYKYKNVLEKIEYCLNKKYTKIHMIGGGIQSKMLCQMTANATNCEVFAGPIEATALGNLAVQFIATGAIKDIKEARQIVADSETFLTYEPEEPEQWDAAYKDFAKLVSTDSIWNEELFKPYSTISFDENSQTEYEHFVDHVIPAPLDSLFQTLSFEDLIDDGTGNLNISYSRGYLINAQLKCLDVKGTAGLTKLTDITLN